VLIGPLTVIRIGLESHIRLRECKFSCLHVSYSLKLHVMCFFGTSTGKIG